MSEVMRILFWSKQTGCRPAYVKTVACYLFWATESRGVSINLLISSACAQSHPKFASIAAVAPLLFSRQLQMSAEKLPQPMALGEAVERGIIANQARALHVVRTCSLCN